MSKLLKINIADAQFADLNLQRKPDGGVTFDTSIIVRICEASGIDPNSIFAEEDNIAGLIVAWYAEHRAGGGEPDPVADDLILEAQAEDDHGSGLSYEPGRA